MTAWPMPWALKSMIFWRDERIAASRTKHCCSRLPRRRLRPNQRLLVTVTNADLNRVLNEPQYSPLPTLSVRFASVINCNTRHAGQIEYLRGLVKYDGWFPGAEK